MISLLLNFKCTSAALPESDQLNVKLHDTGSQNLVVRHLTADTAKVHIGKIKRSLFQNYELMA